MVIRLFHAIPQRYLPPDPPSSREEPMESISSMNIIDGACSLEKREKTHNIHTISFKATLCNHHKKKKKKLTSSNVCGIH